MIKLSLVNQHHEPTPTQDEFTQWLTAAVRIPANINIVILTAAEIKKINLSYRHKNQPTNVLSFTYQPEPLEGELLFCPSVIADEAKTQDKKLADHWAHLTVHGGLHLLGYDHVEAKEAATMQAQEIAILQQFGIKNPYDIIIQSSDSLD